MNWIRFIITLHLKCSDRISIIFISTPIPLKIFRHWSVPDKTFSEHNRQKYSSIIFFSIEKSISYSEECLLLGNCSKQQNSITIQTSKFNGVVRCLFLFVWKLNYFLTNETIFTYFISIVFIHYKLLFMSYQKMKLHKKCDWNDWW